MIFFSPKIITLQAGPGASERGDAEVFCPRVLVPDQDGAGDSSIRNFDWKIIEGSMWEACGNLAAPRATMTCSVHLDSSFGF